MAKKIINAENDLMDFAYGEFVGRMKAYDIRERDVKRQEGELVIEKIMDRDGVTREYATFRLTTGQTAIAGEIYIPIDPTNANIHVTWKGTDDEACVRADIQSAPGEHSYRKREGLILQQINDVVGLVAARSGTKPSLNITGHSLGGALAGMCHNSILRGQAYNLANKLINSADKTNIADAKKILASNEKYSNRMDNISKAHATQLPKEQRSNLGNLGEVFLGTFNPACVDSAVTKNSLELLTVLSKQDTTKYAHRVCLVDGDAVPTAGSSQYLSGATVDVLDQKLLKIDAEVGSGYNRMMAEAGAAVAAGVGIGAIFGPAGGVVGGVAGVFAGLAIAGAKIALAHTAQHFEQDAETKKILLNRNEGKITLHTNTTDEGKKAIDRELNSTSHFIKSLLSIKKGISYMFTAGQEEKELTRLISYDLCLMSKEIENNPANAEIDKIYLSKNGKYIVNDPKGNVKIGSLVGKDGIDMEGFEGKLLDLKFKDSILKVILARGHAEKETGKMLDAGDAEKKIRAYSLNKNNG